MTKQSLSDTSKPPKDSKKNQGKSAKNLKLAMDLNREMEEMLGESGFEPRPAKKTKKKNNKQV